MQTITDNLSLTISFGLAITTENLLKYKIFHTFCNIMSQQQKLLLNYRYKVDLSKVKG